MEYAASVSSSSTVASELVELMRAQSDVSWATAQSCVTDLLSLLHEHRPDMQLTDIIDALQKDVCAVATCVDSVRMRQCLQQLTVAQQDVQQRSWSLHEDLQQICTCLTQLTSLLQLSDRRVALHVLAEDDYQPLIGLVLFLQMETRESVRVQLLSTLQAVLAVDCSLVQVLLPTVLLDVLTTALVQHSFVQCTHCTHALQLLVALLCTQHTLQCQQADLLNADFLCLVLSEIENETWCANECALLLLAVNLHEPGGTSLVHLVDNAACCVHFVERLLVLVNRDDDPVWPYNSTKPVPKWSVLKALYDLYSNSTNVHNLLYTNDVPVLINVLCRKCMDLPQGEQRLASIQLLQVMCDRLGTVTVLRDLNEHIAQAAHTLLDDTHNDTEQTCARQVLMLLQTGDTHTQTDL